MNSRLRISNQAAMAELVMGLAENAATRGTRALATVFAPPESWLLHLAANLQCDYISADSDTDRADRISALLGSERELLVIQLGKIPDLGLLAAAAGTLKIGGVLIAGTDALSRGIERNTSSQPLVEKRLESSNSTRRLEQLATGLSDVYPQSLLCLQVIDELSAVRRRTEPTVQDVTGVYASPVKPDSANKTPAAAMVEQDALLEQACIHLSNNASCSIVISGHRGRGKSTLLARIALHLENTKADFYITALHESALRSFRLHAGPGIAARFVSPEAAARDCRDILLVDEAASFSLKLLQHYTNNCRQLILCSTTEGYEASGRALDVRLLSDLSLSANKLLHLTPVNPWRWQGDDPLEQFTNQLLLNYSKVTDLNVVLGRYDNYRRAAGNCWVRQITQQELVNNEDLLSKVYRLLSDTHYQTTTKDLEHLLDAPRLQLWVQMLENNVVGLLMLEIEGQLPSSLHTDIVAKQRRVKNQLLPQLLAQMTNDTAALHMRFGRVVRLAIVPQLRRMGLASGLLSAITAPSHTSSNNENTRQASDTFDAIGASFASDACSLSFWESHGYTEFHRGFRANPRTGKHAVAVLRCFEPITDRALDQAADIHQDNEKARLAHQQSKTLSSQCNDIGERDARLLARFADGQRSMNDTFAALKRLSNLIELSIDRKHDLSPKQLDAILRVQVKKWLHES